VDGNEIVIGFALTFLSFTTSGTASPIEYSRRSQPSNAMPACSPPTACPQTRWCASRAAGACGPSFFGSAAKAAEVVAASIDTVSAKRSAL
jgi:hypothetical protein